MHVLNQTETLWLRAREVVNGWKLIFTLSSLYPSRSGIQCPELWLWSPVFASPKVCFHQEVKTWCPWIHNLQDKSERAGQCKYKFCCNIQCVPNVMGFGWVIQCIVSSLLNTGSSISSPLASCVCFADHTDCQ